MDVSWVRLIVMGVLFLLLVYAATKASGRTIGIFLGACILLMISTSFLYKGARHQEPVDTAVPRMELAVESHEVVSTEQLGTSNKELWDRLTKSRIDLSDEKPAKEEKDQASEEETTESKPTKPDWVTNPPKRVGNVYRRVVTSDLYSTIEECQLQLEGLLQEAVRERVEALVSERAERSALMLRPESFGIRIGYIMREICKDEYTEVVDASFGEMHRVHVLMEFTPAVENRLKTVWQEHERRHRLGIVGKYAGLALGLLASIYGLLQFDTWTRGYYTKRLLVGVPVVIIAVVFLFLFG